MNRRTDEQPYETREDTQETRVLPVSSSDDARTVPLSQQYFGQAHNSTVAPHVGQEPQTVSFSPQPDPSLTHIRRTRPTAWAIFQHLASIVFLAILLVLSLWFFVRTETGQSLDESSFNEFSYRFMRIQSQTMNMLDLIPACAGILAVIGLLFILLWKHRFFPALIGIGVALAANATTQILKNIVVSKPNYGIQEALMNSAPSGHTTFAAAAGAALFLASPKKLRPLVALIGAVFALAAGFSAMVNGWHRPVDVVSAILLTSIWTIVGLGILRFMRSEELDMSNTHNSGLILVPLLTIAGFFTGFSSVALYLITYFDPIPGGAFIAASCMILTVAAFTTAIQIALLRSQNKERSAYTKVWTY